MNKLKDYFVSVLPTALALAVAMVIVSVARPFLKKIPFVGNHI